ncbi:MAG: hypothetical protein MPN21_20430 [Thermoanaerobaculia bacterium]|nr:hypothetical protein [Thermoanaerobaculia bacterium]
MTKQRILSLALQAFALALLPYALASIIAPFLPGFEDMLQAGSQLTEVQQSPVILGQPPLFFAVTGFGCFLVPVIAVGMAGVWLSFRARNSAKEAQVLEQDRERWGDKALAWWLERLVDQLRNNQDPSAVVAQSRAELLPHLVEPHASWMSRCSEVLAGAPRASFETPPRSAQPRRSLLLRVTAGFLLTLSGFSLCWGILNVAMLVWFGRLPIVDLEVSAAVLVTGSAFPLGVLLATVWLAVSLLRIDRQNFRQREETEAGRRLLGLALVQRVAETAQTLREMDISNARNLSRDLVLATRDVLPPECCADLQRDALGLDPLPGHLVETEVKQGK